MSLIEIEELKLRMKTAQQIRQRSEQLRQSTQKAKEKEKEKLAQQHNAYIEAKEQQERADEAEKARQRVQLNKISKCNGQDELLEPLVTVLKSQQGILRNYVIMHSLPFHSEHLFCRFLEHDKEKPPNST